MTRTHSFFFALFLLAFANTTAANGQTQSTTKSAGPKTTKAKGLPPVEVQKLVAPIALYPDVLVAQILTAATFPMDVVMAARWLRTNPDLKKLTDQKWDPSVLSLCNYPSVLYKLDADLEWTNALGAAFLDQQQDVMSAIQALRVEAKTAGVLASNAEQKVVLDENTIRIVPADAKVVYVPQYNPQVIYVDNDDDDDDVSVAAAATASAISFGAGLALGAWLDMDCNWNSCCVAYCKPGYWGGYYGIHGASAVAWGNSWAAAVGPRRAAVVGPHGGAYVGPRGAAAWHNGQGAAWRRPTTYGAPAYSGRYASYNQYSGNRGRTNVGNTYNVNRTNVNVDRGDRSYYQGGNRTNIQGGNRTNYPQGGGQAAGARPTPYGGGGAGAVAGQRGQYSGQRQQAQARPAGYSSRSSSAFGSSGYNQQVNRASSRGYSSRGYSGRSGGGGGRRGGGGGRR